MPGRLDGQIEVIDPRVLAALRERTPAERIAIGFAAHRFVRERIGCQLRADHPTWSAEQIDAEIARRLLRGTS